MHIGRAGDLLAKIRSTHEVGGRMVGLAIVLKIMRQIPRPFFGMFIARILARLIDQLPLPHRSDKLPVAIFNAKRQHPRAMPAHIFHIARNVRQLRLMRQIVPIRARRRIGIEKLQIDEMKLRFRNAERLDDPPITAAASLIQIRHGRPES